MASCSIFDEDEVFLVTAAQGVVCGLCVESSEYFSSDEDDDDDYENERVKPGTVRVAWYPDGSEIVAPENKVLLADRSLMPGDVVRRQADGKDSQLGYVEDLDVSCVLRVRGSNKFIYNVNSKHIRAMQEYTLEPGDVALGPWVGVIETINIYITLLFADGARCCVPDLDIQEFQDVSDKRAKHSEFEFGEKAFYIGQQLKGVMEDLVSAEWFLSTKSHGPNQCISRSRISVQVVVEDVQMNSVQVRWTSRGFSKMETTSGQLGPPSMIVEGDVLKDLKMLDVFEHCAIQIGDKGYYVIKEGDDISSDLPRDRINPQLMQKMSTESINHMKAYGDGLLTKKHKHKPYKCKLVEKPDVKEDADGDKVPGTTDNVVDMETSHLDPSNNCDVPAVVIDQVDDNDDDSDYEDMTDSVSDTESVDSEQSSASEGMPRTRRTAGYRKGHGLATRLLKKKKGHKSAPKFCVPEVKCEVGDRVAVEVCYTFGMITIIWQDASKEEGIPSTDLFPIHHVDTAEFFPGDFVVDAKDTGSGDKYATVISSNHKGRTCVIKQLSTADKSMSPEEIVPTELSVYDVKDHPYYNYRPGTVVIRIGGYEGNDETPLEAVGQIYRLSSNGTLNVRWANGSVTDCYPQDLYTEVGGEFSEFDSDTETEKSSGSDGGNSETSWETEEEEEVHETPDTEANKAHSTVYGDSLVQLYMSHAEGISRLLQQMHQTLAKFQDVCQGSKSTETLCKTCCSFIFKLYRNFREIRRVLKLPYLDDQRLDDLVSRLRLCLRVERTTNRMQKNVAAEMAKASSEKTHVSTGTSTEPCVDTGTSTELCEIACQTDDDLQDVSCGIHMNVLVGKSVKHGPESGDNPEAMGCETGCNSTSEPTDESVEKSVESLKVSLEKITSSVVGAGKSDGMPIDVLSILLDDDLSTVGATAACYSEGVNKQSGVVDKHGVMDKQDVDKHNDVDKHSGVGKHAVVDKHGVVAIQDAGDVVSTLASTIQYCESLCKVQELITSICQLIQEKMSRLQPDLSAAIQAQIDNKKNAEVGKSANDTGSGNGEQDTESSDTNAVETDNLFTQVADDNTMTDAVSEDRSEPVKHDNLETSNNPDNTQSVDSKVDKKASISDEADLRYSDVLDVDSTETSSEKVNTTFKGFYVYGDAPCCHKFKSSSFTPVNQKSFLSAVRKEMLLLSSSLPAGIVVKGFEDRMDLYSVMILGPDHTPYEDGLFFFDVQLSNDYPYSPPVFHYVSYVPHRFNPNLYADGKVCVSLLGTWDGKGTETWSSCSNLLQILISIQGLILVSEPYFNEAGYERQRGMEQASENSKVYNEMAILRLVEHMSGLAEKPPGVFEEETVTHILAVSENFILRLEKWVETGLRDSSGHQSLCSNETIIETKVNSTSETLCARDTEKQCVSYSSTDNTLEVSSVIQSSDNLANVNHGLSSSCVSSSSACDGSHLDASANIVAYQEQPSDQPKFPLFPPSRGFCLSLKRCLSQFRIAVDKLKERNTKSYKADQMEL